MTKIAILGKSILHLADVPWSDYSWEVWHLNGGFHNNTNIIPRFNKWFEIHDEKSILQVHEDYPDYISFLKESKGNLVTSGISFLPESEVYPYKEITEKLNTKFFKNSISYMIAYALYKYPDMTELGIWGVELHGSGEYHDQEDCVSYWIGRAESLGVKVRTSMHSKLFKNDDYYSKLFENSI